MEFNYTFFFQHWRCLCNLHFLNTKKRWDSHKFNEMKFPLLWRCWKKNSSGLFPSELLRQYSGLIYTEIFLRRIHLNNYLIALCTHSTQIWILSSKCFVGNWYPFHTMWRIRRNWSVFRSLFYVMVYWKIQWIGLALQMCVAFWLLPNEDKLFLLEQIA